MFVVSKAPHEQIDRSQIDQIKIKLKEKFSNQAFQPANLKLIWAGESELIILTENLRLRSMQINLIYAVIELYQEKQLEFVEPDSLKFQTER